MGLGQEPTVERDLLTFRPGIWIEGVFDEVEIRGYDMGVISWYATTRAPKSTRLRSSVAWKSRPDLVLMLRYDTPASDGHL